MNGKPWVPSQFFLFSVHDLCAEITVPHVKGNPHFRGTGIALQMPIPPLNQGWGAWHEKPEEPKKVTLSHQVPPALSRWAVLPGQQSASFHWG